MSARGLRDSLKAIVPNWLANRPGLNVGFKVVYAIALLGDVMIEVALQGLRASWPGKGTPTALALLGQSRLVLRGENESNDHLAARLRAWLDTAIDMGAGAVLAQQIQDYLATNPTVRVVNRAGVFATANPDGTTSLIIDPAWNWDSISNPERNGLTGKDPWWSDLWIIVSPSEYALYAGGFPDPTWRAQWGTTTGLGLGHQVPRVAVDAILSLVSTWKGAHSFVQAIIWTNDTTLFVPGSLGVTGNPDGTWGHWSKNVLGVQVPARTSNTDVANAKGVRYWEPAGGG